MKLNLVFYTFAFKLKTTFTVLLTRLFADANKCVCGAKTQATTFDLNLVELMEDQNVKVNDAYFIAARCTETALHAPSKVHTRYFLINSTSGKPSFDDILKWPNNLKYVFGCSMASTKKTAVKLIKKLVFMCW